MPALQDQGRLAVQPRPGAQEVVGDLRLQGESHARPQQSWQLLLDGNPQEQVSEKDFLWLISHELSCLHVFLALTQTQADNIVAPPDGVKI